MALQILNEGAAPGDNTGDTLRTAIIKCKSNFSELYSLVASSTAQNLIFASPNGSSGLPSFRALNLNDFPTTGASSGSAIIYNGSTVAWSNLTSTILQTIYPVGSLYVNFADDTSPATVLGFGTWTRIEGRVVVGKSTTDVEFDTLLETGGAKTHTLTTNEMPAHSHSYNDTNTPGATYSAGGFIHGGTVTGNTTGSAGGGAAHNNLQPYITASMWRRTA